MPPPPRLDDIELRSKKSVHLLFGGVVDALRNEEPSAAVTRMDIRNVHLSKDLGLRIFHSGVSFDVVAGCDVDDDSSLASISLPATPALEAVQSVPSLISEPVVVVAQACPSVDVDLDDFDLPAPIFALPASSNLLIVKG